MVSRIQRLDLDWIRGVGIFVLWSFRVLVFALFRIGSSSIVGVDCGFCLAVDEYLYNV